MDQDQTERPDRPEVTAAEIAAQLTERLGQGGALRFVERFEVYVWDYVVPAHFDEYENAGKSLAERMLACVNAQAFLSEVKEAVGS